MGGEEGGWCEAGRCRRGGDDQDVTLALGDREQARQPFRDQVLMRGKMIVGEGFPVGQQMYPQSRCKPADFLGETLRFERTGGDCGKETLAICQLGDGKGIGGSSKFRQ